MKLTVVVPCYNEEKNIPLILERFNDVICGRNIEVILVDNGSTDDSARVIADLIPVYFFATTVSVPVNQGYGYGIIQGLKGADGDYIGWTHADMQTDPADVVRAYKMLSKRRWENVYLKGMRRGRPFMDRLFTYGMGIFESAYFRMPMWDINGQPNIFPRRFYEKWKEPPYDFSLDLFALYMARMENLPVVRFPVLFPERTYGHSKWNTGFMAKWRLIKRTVAFSAEMKRSLRHKKQRQPH